MQVLDAGATATTAVLDGDEHDQWPKMLYYQRSFCGLCHYFGSNRSIKRLQDFRFHRRIQMGRMVVGAHEDKMGIRGTETSDIVLDNVRVPKENLCGQRG